MIYLFVVCLCVHLVSTNPLANLLLQTRPHCNNGYNSYNVPIQNNQNYNPPILVQNPMTTCPKNQPHVPQNALPIQIKVDDTNHSYLNKILSNPMVQNILNRNSNNFHQNSQDIALQATPGQTPNVVNNYYIIPSECLQGNGDGIEVIKKIIGDHAVVNKNCECPNQKNTDIEMKNVQQPHSRPNEEKRRPKGNKRRNHDNESMRNQNKKNSQKRKRKHGNQNNGNQRDNTQDQNQSNYKNREILTIKDERTRKRNGTQESEPKKNGSKKHKKPKTESKNRTVDDIQDAKISSKNDTISKEFENKPRQKERKNITDISGDNKDEDVIRDIHNKFPGIPEDIIRRLLRYLRRQLQIHPKPNSDPNNNFNQTQNTNKDNKTRRNNRKNPKKRRQQKTHTNLDEDTKYTISSTTEGSLITSTMIETKEPSNNQVENSTHFKNVQDFTLENAVIETTTNSDMQKTKLEEQDTISDLEKDVDDYFPDFRFDKMYMSEDDYIRSLRDNRFYYTTDRNYEPGNNDKNEESSEIYYEPFEPTKSQKVEDTLSRPDDGYFDDQYEGVIKDYSVEDLAFQTPPILEYPDFETKPIIKYFDAEGPIYKPDNKNIDNVNDKSSIYSDAKTVNTPLKNKPKSDIETVFARSKVAKYGQTEELEEVTIDKNENYKHDDTILVYAKSVPDF